MLQDSITLKQLFAEHARFHLSTFPPQRDELCLVHFNVVDNKLRAELSFHRITSGEDCQLLQPQRLWFYDKVMSFTWIPNDSVLYDKNYGNINWLNCIRNKHCEEETIYYKTQWFAKMNIVLKDNYEQGPQPQTSTLSKPVTDQLQLGLCGA